MKILAIDDNNDNLISLRALLQEAFPDSIFFFALNGKQGIEFAIEKDPDVILLDIIMPEMDGFEVCRRLKLDDRLFDIPVVFLTASKEGKQNRIKALEVGAEGFLSKPIDETELTAQIRAMVKIKSVNKHKRDENEHLSRLVLERTNKLEQSQREMMLLMEDLKAEIEARKKTELILQRTKRWQDTLISNLPGFAYRCMFDPYWTMKYISDGCKGITGYSPEDFIYNRNKKFNDIIVPEYREAIWQKWQKALLYKTACELEYPIITEIGEIRWVWERGRGVFSEGGQLLNLEGFITDITERKLAENKIKESEARLQELNATKDKFFSIIAHDLKSPFNSIIGFSDLLIDKIRDEEYASAEEYAGYIQKSSHRVMALLLNLLEWSISQTGRMDFNPEFVEIGALINEAIALSVDSAQQKEITISNDLSNRSVAVVDKTMISTVLRNLISNAIKFTNLNGEIAISVEEMNEELIVAVCDNGVGITKENIDKVFRIDTNYSTNGTQDEQGSGLGLLLCKEFILKHNGRIWVESEPGVGSTFYFTIPKGVGELVENIICQ